MHLIQFSLLAVGRRGRKGGRGQNIPDVVIRRLPIYARTLQYLTDGAYDAEQAVFKTARGHSKFYVATDHLHSPLYRAFTPDESGIGFARADERRGAGL